MSAPTSNQLRDTLLARNLGAVHRRTSQIFFWLFLVQWALAIVLALVISPATWSGAVSSIHPHVLVAVFLGGAINALPLLLLKLRPEWWLTRHLVAVTQMLWSGLLIHITGGRIETHFHIFGSLAFVAFYRDWKLLPTATIVVAVDHLARGLLWPESVYGIENPEWWRFLEHAAWVAFEDVVLVLGCWRSLAEMRVVADREAALAHLNTDIEAQVRQRTAELTTANAALAKQMRLLLEMESELRQAQKLESVGRLASGVAHEINTPVQFVNDSIHFVRDSMEDLHGVFEKLGAVQRSVLAGVPSKDAADDAALAEESADLDYLWEHVPKALNRAIDGLGRVAVIVRSMKEFAHPDSKEMTTTDLNRAIESTLTIASNEYKYVAELETDLGELPPILCHPGDLNQAVLNIVVNAAHAIADVVRNTDDKGRIHVRTSVDGDDVVLSIADSGRGIPEALRERIFDPFFTTKEVGKGTGQGLAIARSVIVDKHHGQLTFETGPQGTTFYIRLPIRGVSAQAA